MGLGAVLAAVIVLRFGKSAQTDAFFSAFSVYGLLALVCLSFRTTLVHRLSGRSKAFGGFDRLLGAGVVLLVLAGVVLLGLGGLLAALIAGALGAEPQALARSTLAILWLAVAGQLVAALAAASLGTRGQFGVSSLAYVVGAVCSIIFLLVAAPFWGLLAVSAGVAVGSVVSAGLMVLAMFVQGYRMDLAQVLSGGREVRTLLLMLTGSVLPLVVQVNYVISLAFAGYLGVGAVTLYAYSYSAAALVMGVTATPTAVVLAAPLAQIWDRQPATLTGYTRGVFRLGLVLVLPAIGLVGVGGGELIELIFGRVLTPADAGQIVAGFIGLGGAIVAMLALQVPLLAAYALSRHARVAAFSLSSIVVQVALTFVAAAAGGLAPVGAAMSGSVCVLLMVVAAIVYGRGAGVFLLTLCDELGPVLLLSASSFGLAHLAAGALGGGAWDIVLGLLGVSLFAVLIRIFLPDHFAQLVHFARMALPTRSALETPPAAAGGLST